MPTNNLSNEELGYEGLNFENILQECLACAVFAVNAGKITAVTPAAERLLGLSSTEHHALESLPAPLQAIVREAQTGTVVTDRAILFPTPAQQIALSVTALPLSAKGPAAAVVVVVQNVSFANLLEHKLRRLDRLAGVGTLSASMAHEIKNALVPLRTFIDLLLEENSDSELAETVRRETGRVDTIVTHLLKFAAPAPPKLSVIHLHEVLEHSLRMAQHRIASKVITIHREFNALPDALQADDHQLEQAFVNLLLNAIEAIGAEGTLTLSTELAVPDGGPPQLREGSAAKVFRVKISDTGMGISAENLHHIFNPFFTTKQNGTGLGLSVTRRIIEEHHGIIHVASQPRKGTTFTVELPDSKP